MRAMVTLSSLLLLMPSIANGADTCPRQILALSEHLKLSEAHPGTSLVSCVQAGTIHKNISQIQADFNRAGRAFILAWAAYEKEAPAVQRFSSLLAASARPTCGEPSPLLEQLKVIAARMEPASEQMAKSSVSLSDSGLAFAESYVNKPVTRRPGCEDASVRVKALEREFALVSSACSQQSAIASAASRQLKEVELSLVPKCQATDFNPCPGAKLHPTTGLCQMPLEIPSAL